MINRELLFVPYAVTRTKVSGRFGLTYTGFMEIFIFGVRVAKIQETKPWE